MTDANDKPQPSADAKSRFVEALLAKPQTRGGHTGWVELSKAQLKTLCAPETGDAVRDVLQFNTLQNLGAAEENSGKLPNENILKSNLETSLINVLLFIDRIKKDNKGLTEEMALPSDELPQSWQQDIANARKAIVRSIKNVSSELGNMAKTAKGLEELYKQLDNLPENVMDKIQFLHLLDKADALLSEAFPSEKAIARNSKELIALDKSKLLSFNSGKLGDIQEIAGACAPELLESPEMKKLEVFIGRIGLTDNSAKTVLPQTETRLPIHEIPSTAELETLYTQLRSAMMEKIVPCVSNLPSQSRGNADRIYIYDNHVSKMDIALLANGSQYYDYARMHFANGHQPDEKHLKLRQEIHDAEGGRVSFETMIQQCCALDSIHRMWQKSLSQVHTKIDAMQERQAAFSR